eukprot:scaffold1757_cov218-Ochromonas_danica.AAC.1
MAPNFPNSRTMKHRKTELRNCGNGAPSLSPPSLSQSKDKSTLTTERQKNIITMLLWLLNAFIEELQAELRLVIYLIYLILKLFHIIFSFLVEGTEKILSSLKKTDTEEENRKTEEERRLQELKDMQDAEEETKKTEEERRLLEEKRTAQEVRRIQEEKVLALERKLEQVLMATANLRTNLERENAARVELEKALQQVQESSHAEISDLNNKLQAIDNAREADRATTESKLQQVQESSHAEISDLNNKLERKLAARVEAEGKLKEGQSRNEKLLSQLNEGQAAFVRNCSLSFNWQQMIEAGDATLLKTLETYNAIHRIPGSLIHHHFTMTVDGIEFKAGGMSVYSSTMLLCILIEMGMTALHMAAANGNEELARLLLLHPEIDVNVVDSEYGTTPLHVACKIDGNAKVVKVLLTVPRIDVNKANKLTYVTVFTQNGCSPLHVACSSGCVEIVRTLLLYRNSVDVNKADKDGWTPFYTACHYGHVEVVKVFLLGGPVDVNKPTCNITSRKLSWLFYLSWFRDQDDYTPLTIACKNGHVELVTLLLHDPRVNANMTTDDGRTPLHYACRGGHIEVVKMLLLDERVDVNKTNKDGCIPLHRACSKGNVEVIRMFLLDERVDVATADKDGRTPLHYACRGGHIEVVKMLLLDERVDVNKSDNGGHIEVAKMLLLDERVDVNKTDNDGWASLHIACENGYLEVVKMLLLDGRVDVNKADNQGRTPLDVAKTEDIKALLRAKGAIQGRKRG